MYENYKAPTIGAPYTQAKKYPQIDVKEPRFNLHLPKIITDKISFLCSAISREEWSGILFYTVEGSMKNFSLSMTVQDILPMDKGTSTFTGFDLDNRFIDYLIANPEAMNWKVGLIHSHNTMAVFFSGTDIQELHDNAKFHNFYLSLIVNNFEDMTAKLAVYSTTETEEVKVSYTALDEEGQPYFIEESVQKIPNERLYIFDCDIKREKQMPILDEQFSKAVQEILKPKYGFNSFPPQANKTTTKVTTSTAPATKVNDRRGTKMSKRERREQYTQKANQGLPNVFYQNVVLSLLDENSFKDDAEYNESEFEDKVGMIIDIIYGTSDIKSVEASEMLMEKLLRDYDSLFPYSGKSVPDIIRSLSRIAETVEDLLQQESYLRPFYALLKRTISNMEEPDIKKGNKEEVWTD